MTLNKVRNIAVLSLEMTAVDITATEGPEIRGDRADKSGLNLGFAVRLVVWLGTRGRGPCGRARQSDEEEDPYVLGVSAQMCVEPMRGVATSE